MKKDIISSPEKPKEMVIIPRPERLKELEQAIAKAGPEKLHILTDFDRTLTKAFVNGQYVSSLISVLRSENYLTADYAPEAHRLYDQYHAIETDPRIPLLGGQPRSEKNYFSLSLARPEVKIWHCSGFGKTISALLLLGAIIPVV